MVVWAMLCAHSARVTGCHGSPFLRWFYVTVPWAGGRGCWGSQRLETAISLFMFHPPTWQLPFLGGGLRETPGVLDASNIHFSLPGQWVFHGGFSKPPEPATKILELHWPYFLSCSLTCDPSPTISCPKSSWICPLLSTSTVPAQLTAPSFVLQAKLLTAPTFIRSFPFQTPDSVIANLSPPPPPAAAAHLTPLTNFPALLTVSPNSMTTQALWTLTPASLSLVLCWYDSWC